VKDRKMKVATRREFCAWGLGMAAALLPRPGRGEEVKDGVLYPRRIEADGGKFSWYEAVIEKIQPLKHDRGSRWPLITWEGFSTEPQDPA
jgi:hypothetical protein